jgi:hypothetical protein
MTRVISSAPAASAGESATTPQNARARGKRCGAKTRAGGECQAPTVNGKSRCRRHGGASTGARSTEGKARIVKAATKHGIYGSTYTESEIAMLPALEASIGALDAEIVFVKAQLIRAGNAQKSAFEKDADGLEVVKRHDREASEFGPGDETVRERVQYSAIIDRLAGRLESLERTRSELIDKAKARATDENEDAFKYGGEWQVHVVTAANVHLYRDGKFPPANEVLTVDEEIPENPIL